MLYRTLGQTGLQTSAFSFGTYLTFGHKVHEKEALTLMDKAYELGVNLFDNAEVYALGQAEIIMGAAIKQLKWSRDSYIIMTKVFWGGKKPTQMGLNRKHIMDGCHNALKRLSVDYIDILLCHRPDTTTPLIETVSAMHHLIQQGKILYWGTSEWSENQIIQAILIAKKHGLTPPSVEQFKYSMLERNKAERELKSLLQSRHIGATTTMPLAGGFLTGKYFKTTAEDSRFSWLKDADKDLASAKYVEFQPKIQALEILARDAGLSMAQLALGWCLANTDISSVIIGTTKVAQLTENLRTLEVMQHFAPEFMHHINSILQNKPAIEDRNYFDYASVIERV
jgi:voltage-dependent potassium channel beta subunit